MHVCAGAHAVQLERKAWSQPVDAGAISDRGKQQARPSSCAGARPPAARPPQRPRSPRRAGGRRYRPLSSCCIPVTSFRPGRFGVQALLTKK